jgi:hypothetical protein
MKNRRQVPRYLFGVKAHLSQAATGVASEVIVVNISVSGCCAESPITPKVEETCDVKIEWRGGEIRAQAKVLWKSKEGRAGLRFLTIDQESQDRLRELCATLRLAPLTDISHQP